MAGGGGAEPQGSREGSAAAGGLGDTELGEGARAGQDMRVWGLHRERENTCHSGRRMTEKGR